MRVSEYADQDQEAGAVSRGSSWRDLLLHDIFSSPRRVVRVCLRFLPVAEPQLGHESESWDSLPVLEPDFEDEGARTASPRIDEAPCLLHTTRTPAEKSPE